MIEARADVGAVRRSRQARIGSSIRCQDRTAAAMLTASLMSMPRFDLVVFPAFILLALWGRRPIVNSVIVSLFLPLLGLFTVLFADWYWLA